MTFVSCLGSTKLPSSTPQSTNGAGVLPTDAEISRRTPLGHIGYDAAIGLIKGGHQMSTEEERHSLEVTCPSARGSCDDCQEIDLPETPDKAVWCTRVMAVRQNLRVGKKEYLVQQKLPFELLIIPKPPSHCHHHCHKPRPSRLLPLLLLVVCMCSDRPHRKRKCQQGGRRRCHWTRERG
jgi:hypothetical protein